MCALIVRVAFWLAASAWIALGMVWVVLHFVIVPRIAEFRPMLEHQVSRIAGVPVRIGDIVARSNGLIPSVELNDVRLLDAQGRTALKLPSVMAALSARSLLGGGLEQLIVDRPELEVRRSRDGKIWVAGLALPGGNSTDSSGADWVFSQPELVIRHGTVTWIDETRDVAPLALTDVDWVLRNQHRSHAMRLDANPPALWGSRLSLTGIFRQPLLSRHASAWQEWDGRLFANFAQVDLAQLRLYADLGVDLAQGAGSLRAWADVSHGKLVGATADLALDDVVVTIDPKLEALGLRGVTGRLGAKWMDGGMEFSTQALQFETQDGLHWPGGNVRLSVFAGDARKPAHGELQGDRLDLAALAQIAHRLPLDDSLRTTLTRLAPKGVVQELRASWQGPVSQPTAYAAKGRVTQLAIAPGGTPEKASWPGFRGADIDFDFNQSAGRASIAMTAAELDLPGIFEEPLLPLDQLTGDLQWKMDAGQISLSLPNLRFSNADAQGEAQIKWQTAGNGTAGTGSAAHAADRFPGLLDLQGSMSRADGTRVYRYLPAAIPKLVREYVHEAVQGGNGTGVKFKVKGNLHEFPFTTAKQGDFRISADIHNAAFAFAPQSLMHKDSLPWPTLVDLSGELVVDRATLQVKGAHGGAAQADGLHISKADAVVDSLYHGATVSVAAEVQGPLSEALAVVNGSPLGGLIGHALEHASASGNADYRFKLALPIAAVERATVRGTVTLAGNDLQVTPETPRMTRARGAIAFSETGFSVAGAQARLLGGDVRIDGGMSGFGAAASTSPSAAKPAAPQSLRFQGTATSEGLRQARELGLVARLAQYANGSAAYTATLGLRGSVPELQVNSTLAGMALTLPAPFAKPAETALPLHLETAAVRSSLVPGADGEVHAQDQFLLDVGKLVNVAYVRDVSGADARVLRGAIGVGLTADESAPLPADGVVANINLASANVDAWSDVLSHAAGTELSASSIATPGSHVSTSYLPTILAVRAKELTVGGRKLSNLVIGGAREGPLWRANVDASELNGYVEYRQPVGPAAGRLYARLARLAIAQSTARDVENVLEEQPASIPALDIVVDDFELRGKRLGRVEIDAVNVAATAAGRDAPREWRLNHFNITMPEAVLTASGNWGSNPVSTSPAVAARAMADRKRTVLNFKLDISDSGELLDRFGMKGVVANGRGSIAGQVAWQGSPISVDYPSLGGSFKINVENGRFLKKDPGLAKLLGVLSLQSLPRRLTLDFRDVFSEGFSFDSFNGEVSIAQGVAHTGNLKMAGVNAAVLMEGDADIAKETQNIRVVVVPELNVGGGALVWSAINPIYGLSTFLAQLILRRPLIEATTKEYLVDGTWDDPHFTEVPHKAASKAASEPAKPQESK